jgi:hypothetical protein
MPYAPQGVKGPDDDGDVTSNYDYVFTTFVVLV